MTIDNKQMALLKNRLQMPLIIRDMLITNKTPTADENYALHEMLGNFAADEALLCSAFVMKEIANLKNITSNNAAFLHIECERLIERYSARDNISDENPEVWAETQSGMMSVIYEDISEFLELIELCQLSFEVTSPQLVKFLNIITTQLQSHMMIIDEVISMQQAQEIDITLPQPELMGISASNVIMFPS